MKELWPVGRDGDNRERSFIMRNGDLFEVLFWDWGVIGGWRLKVFVAVGYGAVDDGAHGFGEGFHGVACEDGYVGIFAGFEAAYSVVDAADAGGVAGDGAEAFFHGEAGFYGEAGAEGEGLDEGDGVVCGDGYQDSGLVEDCGGFEGHVLDFYFAAAGEVGAYYGGKSFFCEFFGYEVAFAAVVEGHGEAEFFGYPYGCEDVVGPVYVGFEGDFAFEYGEPGFHAEIGFKGGIGG